MKDPPFDGRLWFRFGFTDLFFPRRAARALFEQETLDGAVEGLLGLLGWVCWCHFGVVVLCWWIKVAGSLKDGVVERRQ